MRPHAGGQGEDVRQQDNQRRGSGAPVAGMALALLLLAIAAGALPGSPLAVGGVRAAPLPAATTPSDSPTDTPTATASATATPTPPPTISLVSPTPKQGQSSPQAPSGAWVTITGTNFTAAQVTIFASRQATCGAPLATLGSTTSSNGGFQQYAFVWPTTLPPGQYYICGTGMTANAPGFYEVTSAVPTLALSTAAVQQGQSVTITGSNFFGATAVDVTLHAGSMVHAIQSSVAPDGNGRFSVQYVPDASLTGEVEIEAASLSENGATPALQASVFLNVLLPPSTATVVITPTAQSTKIPAAVPPKTTGDNAGLLVAVIAAIALGLIIVLGVLAFFLLRRRAGGSQAPGYLGGAAGPGGYGGYLSGGPTAHGRAQTGRPVGLASGADGDSYGQALKFGAVAQWEEEPRPGPDWQPRPMSGRRRYDETPMPEYSDEFPTDASRYTEAGGYEQNDYRPEAAPPDPWADPERVDDLNDGRGVTNPANYPDEEWTQVQPRRQQQELNATAWHNEPGPGTTRPDNTAEDGAGAKEPRTATERAEDSADTEAHGEA